MPFPRIMGKRESRNLEQLRRREWGQDYADNITPQSHPTRPLNGEAVMVSNPIPESQSLYWGEEKVDGAIYRVALKKVRYHTTTKLPFNESVSHLEWETQKRLTIKAGTLAKLVEYLTHDCIEYVDGCIHVDDPGYLVAFLNMYQTFSSADEVVAALFDRFKKEKKLNPGTFENVMRGIIKVLLVWLEHFPNHFNKDPNFKLLKQIQAFAEKEITENLGHELVKKTQQILEKAAIAPVITESTPPPQSSDQESSDGSESAFISEECRLADFETTVIAEQLTLIDAELFKLVVPQHCIGCIWSRRDKNDNIVKASSVKATVNQFNAVSHRVVATILVGDIQGCPGLLRRAKRIEAWIEIAQECRDLKNFSSLKAIMSALKSVPIHRLRKTWSLVPRAHILDLEKLSKLVSEDSNQQTGREVLKKEGTAKTVEISKKASLNRKQSQKNPENGFINGTVPYLGTFLTDLMMLDSAYPDLIGGNLINFEKRRKEFEIIAQIKLFQEAAKNYYIHPNERFRKWFDSIETLTESECFTLSCNLEADTIPKRQSSLFRSRKLKSENDLDRLGKNLEDEQDNTNKLDHRRQDSSSSCASEGSQHNVGTGYIIRVSVEDATSYNLYKSIWVSEVDRTPAVIKSALFKHNLEDESCKDYDLVQIVSQGIKVTIPKDANVYYAANTKMQPPLSFLIRRLKPS